jgi:hypothetical protein
MKIALTSISPRHAMAHAQPMAVQSWVEAGFKVVSLNSPKEIAELREAYPSVEFVPCFRTMEGTFKAPYIPISAFIDYAKEQALPQVMLINSDIVIKDVAGDLGKYWDWSVNGLVIANREDHDGTFTNGKRYLHGFDVFMLSSKHYGLITQTMFCMGQTWWDYWLPYRFIRRGVQVVGVREPMFWHQSHAAQYSHDDWVRMTEHFRWVEKYRSAMPQKINDEVYQLIRSSLR